MALDGNGRWCYLDPKLGAMHAVAEAARKVACTGATPVAATNCLNFGNPEKPEIMAQLSAAIDGIAEACTALGTPITGGNVRSTTRPRAKGSIRRRSLGIVGIIEDVTKAVPVATSSGRGRAASCWHKGGCSHTEQEFGSSEYAKEVLGQFWGAPPALDLDLESRLQKCIVELASQGLVNSAHDISDGGMLLPWRMAFQHGFGVKAELNLPSGRRDGPVCRACQPHLRCL